MFRVQVSLKNIFYIIKKCLLKFLECIISPWRNWSNCLGNCDYAQRVRNRDVLRPPFPEKNLVTSEIFIRACPPLYEVETCIPEGCEEESPFARVT